MRITENKWVNSTLGDLIDIKHGFAFQGEFFRDDPPGDILLTPGNFAIGGGFKADKFKYYVGSVPEDYVLEEGALLVTMTDLSKESDTLGFPAIIPKSFGSKFLHNQRLGKILIKNSAHLHRRFLYYLLCTKEYRQEVISSATGTTVKHTSPNRILAFNFFLPPFEEQRSIANILGSLDDKIELNRQMNETLEAMARSIFQSWFVDFGPVRAMAEGRQPTGIDAETAALFPDSFEEIDGRELPRGWKILSLNDCIKDIFDYRGKTPKKLGDDWSQDGIIVISAKNIKNGELINLDNVKYVSESLYEKWMKSDLERGDILMTSEAPLGELFYLAKSKKMCLSQRLFCIRANQKIINSALLYLTLNSSHVQSELLSRETGTTVTGIRQSLLRTIPILVPPLNLQEKIAPTIESLLFKMNSNNEQSRTLAQIRDVLLPKLMSGEIRVGDNPS